MIQLKQDLAALRRFFEPWLTAPHGPVIWAPEESDPNVQFKQDMIAKTNQVIVAAESALAGCHFEAPQFGESEFKAIEETLSTDPEGRDFIELAVACKRVAQSLARVAA